MSKEISKDKSKNEISKKVNREESPKSQNGICPYTKKCGGCKYIDISNEEQLKIKEKQVRKLFLDICDVAPITGMNYPYQYRNKVNATFGRTKKGEIISGTYEEGTHNIVNIEKCLIENKKADEIIQSIKGMLKSFKIKTYDEDSQYGLLRHIMIRTGHKTGQVMVVLVTASPIFPSKNNFVKALREKHPEITTVVQNINDKKTSMVLGERDIVLYGKGYIEDILCGIKYRISPQSFYQINSIQTEKLYKKAIELAELKGNEKIIDAYCGIGTIGMTASKNAKEIIGVELNKDAVRDAINNAKANGIKNVRFVCDDAGKFMVNMAAKGESIDVVLMDPPRAGSDEAFLNSLVKLNPKKVVYISCNPETLKRDMMYLRKRGYVANVVYPYDMFPFSGHIECVVLMSKVQS